MHAGAQNLFRFHDLGIEQLREGECGLHSLPDIPQMTEDQRER
jgi:hypothetical protein